MRNRDTVRMILMDERNRVLMFKIQDSFPVYREWPNNTIFWVMPGGGLERGETFEEALVREAWEEIGIRLETIGPCVWTEQPVLQFESDAVRFNTRYYFVRIKYHHVDLSRMTDGEQEFVRDYRWWDVAEMRTSEEILLPPGLPGLLEPLISGTIPTEPVHILRL